MKLKSLTRSCTLSAVLAVFVGLAVVGCGGGGGKPQPPPPIPALSILSINTNPTTIHAGAYVELSATYNDPSLASGRVKIWEVSAGSLTEQPPDFTLLIRETAGVKSTSAILNTTADKVYWRTPTSPGSYTVKLSVAQASKTSTFTVVASPLVLSVQPASGGKTVVSVRANSVSKLYQAAFRVQYDPSRYTPIFAEPGSFLGTENEILFLGLLNQNGFVPVGITLKGDAPGKSGSGELARITFKPKTSSRNSSSLSLAGFDISFFVLLDEEGKPIS